MNAVTILALAALLLCLAVVGLVLLRRRRAGGRIAAGRVGRIADLGHLSARLSASWTGAALRRLFAGRAGRARIDERRRRAEAETVARTMGQMKGAVMKLGQMVSFVTEEVPAEYRQALAQLQTSAPAMDLALLRDTAERELGRPLERAFARFDPRPLASASIGQVHAARLPGGEDVVVKIQYPGVAEAIRADLANLGMLHRFVGLLYPGLDPGPVVQELRDRLTEELDYRRELTNQAHFRALYEDHPFIRIPRVHPSHSTANVLTMERVRGRRLDDVLRGGAEERDRYGEILYRFVFGSIARHGVFNGDPHPGNYLFDDQGRVVFLDFGCVKYFPETMLRTWNELVAVHLQDDRAAFRALAVQLGFLKEDAPLDADRVFDYFGYFYEPFQADRPFTFTSEWNARSFKMIFSPDGPFAGMEKRFNMPPDFVFVNRIHWGVFSILAQLGATGNWHRIEREYLLGDPPSTDLGRQDAAHRARRARADGRA